MDAERLGERPQTGSLILFLAGLWMLMPHMPARAADKSCDTLPGPVLEILGKENGWSVVTLGDLDQEEQAFWREKHPRACPGHAAVMLDEGGESYALSLRRGGGDKVFRQVLVARATPQGYAVQTVIAPIESEIVYVVMGLKPGKYLEHDSFEQVEIKTDSILVTSLFAEGMIFFPDGDGFRHIIH